jgi:hypothetical protein
MRAGGSSVCKIGMINTGIKIETPTQITTPIK